MSGPTWRVAGKSDRTWAITHDAKPTTRAWFVDEKEAALAVLALNAAPDLLVACEAAADQGQHADECAWWNTSAHDLQSAGGQAEAEAACNCFVRDVRAAIAKARGGVS